MRPDRKSTRLNSSHLVISYAVFCLKKKKKEKIMHSYMWPQCLRAPLVSSAVRHVTPTQSPADVSSHRSACGPSAVFFFFFLLIRPPPRSPLFPTTPLFPSAAAHFLLPPRPDLAGAAWGPAISPVV